jgi:hypothetical protein
MGQLFHGWYSVPTGSARYTSHVFFFIFFSTSSDNTRKHKNEPRVANLPVKRNVDFVQTPDDGQNSYLKWYANFTLSIYFCWLFRKDKDEP